MKNILYIIKSMYFYLFYKLYKLFQVDERDWLSEWKAGLSLDVLEICLAITLVNYYNVFIDRYFSIEQPNMKIIVGFIYLLFIFIPNYFIFHHHDQWKNIVTKYEQLPRNKNRIGDWLVYSTIIFLIANFIFSYYLMSQIDWKPYR